MAASASWTANSVNVKVAEMGAGNVMDRVTDRRWAKRTRTVIVRPA